MLHKSLLRLGVTLVTHIEVSDEGAVAAGDITIAGARDVFEACELPRNQPPAERGTYSREELRAALATKGAVYHGWELADVEVAGERLQCTLRHRATGEILVALFDYVVGADGLCSTVREHARRSPAVAARVALIGDARRVVLGEPDFGWSRVKYGARQAMLDGAALAHAFVGRRGERPWPEYGDAPPPDAFTYHPVRSAALRLATRAVALLPLCAVLAATWYGSSHS